jgi:hypothetical protein
MRLGHEEGKEIRDNEPPFCLITIYPSDISVDVLKYNSKHETTTNITLDQHESDFTTVAENYYPIFILLSSGNEGIYVTVRLSQGFFAHWISVHFQVSDLNLSIISINCSSE